MAKLKVLFFDEAVAFGGSVVVLAHLLRHIDRQRFIPMLVTSLDQASVESLFKPEDILYWFRPRLHYADQSRWMARCPINGNWPRRFWAYLFTVVAITVNLPRRVQLFYRVWKARPSILHVNNGREGLMATRLFGTPLIIHLHGMALDFLYGGYDTRVKAAMFVSVSKYITAEAVKHGVPANRIVDVPNPAPAPQRTGISSSEWRTRFGLPTNAIVMAHVGRMVRWKGQVEFLEAFSRIAPTCPKVFALIVGDDMEGFSSDYPRSLRQLVANHGLGERVVFTGHIDNVIELMAFADIVVHSSIDPEPFGLVITEAMAAGAAVIAAKLGAPIEIIDHDVTGLLVDPKNVEEFATALSELVTDETRRKQMAQAGQRVAKEKYSPEAFARQMEAVYEQVARNVAPGGRSR